MVKKKSNAKKWNRRHEFRIHKEPKKVVKKKKGKKETERHPAYVFASRGNQFRFFAFTHSKTTKGKKNIEFNNIDPEEEGPSYLRPVPLVDEKENFEKSEKKYRIHKDDIEKLQKEKKKYYK